MKYDKKFKVIERQTLGFKKNNNLLGRKYIPANIYMLSPLAQTPMVQHTQTIRRQQPPNCFECVGPFCGVCAEKLRVNTRNTKKGMEYVQSYQ